MNQALLVVGGYVVRSSMPKLDFISLIHPTNVFCRDSCRHSSAVVLKKGLRYMHCQIQPKRNVYMQKRDILSGRSPADVRSTTARIFKRRRLIMFLHSFPGHFNPFFFFQLPTDMVHPLLSQCLEITLYIVQKFGLSIGTSACWR